MMDKNRSQKILIISVVCAVFFLALLVKVSMGLSKYRKDFRNEMAQRLDLEEKISKMEKERRASLEKIDSLQQKLTNATDEAQDLKEALARKEEEKLELEETLKELKNPAS